MWILTKKGANVGSISQAIYCLDITLRVDSTVAFFATVQQEANRSITRNLEYYNLDMIVSVGYRVNSKQGTRFKIWATSLLKDYLVKGYASNEYKLRQANGQLNEIKATLKLIEPTNIKLSMAKICIQLWKKKRQCCCIW